MSSLARNCSNDVYLILRCYTGRMKVHVKKIEKHPLLQAKATKTITPEESELRIREVNWIRLSADCVGGRELVGPVRVNVGQMILTLGPKLQVTSCNLGRSSSAIVSTFQDRRTTDAPAI